MRFDRRRTLAVIAACVIGTTVSATPARAGLNQWTSGGPPDESILALALNPLTPSIVHAGSNGDGVFRTQNGGASWVQSNTGLTNLIVPALAVNPLDTAVVYAGTTGGGVFRSLDGGNSWAPANSGLNNPLITAIAVNPLAPTTLYAGTTGGGIFRSANGGNSWAPVNSGLVNTLITALAVNPVTPTVVYAGTAGGGVFRSPDGGNSWVPVNTGLVNTVVSALAINPQSPGTLYAGTIGGGVFKSGNGGAAWVAVNGGLANTVVTGLALNPALPTTVYASTTGSGVFRTTSAGASWAPFNVGLANLVVNALAIAPSGLCVHAATRGTGVFDIALAANACTPIAVAASVLPSSRSVAVGTAATAFATIVNPGSATAVGCGIGPLTVVPAAFLFQTTDPLTNVVTGTANTAVDILPGGLQTYVISLTPAAAFAATDMRLDFGCTTTASAPAITGVNTLLLSASTTPVADIVSIAAADGGYVNIPGATGTGAFAVATVNMGAGSTITASADTGGAPVPVSIAICESDPVTAACLAPAAASTTRNIGPSETPTYAVFVTGSANVIDNPAVSRVFVRFKDPLGVTRGSTSVAARTQ